MAMAIARTCLLERSAISQLCVPIFRANSLFPRAQVSAPHASFLTRGISSEPTRDRIPGRGPLLKDSKTDPKPFSAIPRPKGIDSIPGLSVLAHNNPLAGRTKEKYKNYIDSLFRTYGPIFTFRVRQQVVMISDANDVETVLQNESSYPHSVFSELPLLYAENNKCKPSIEALNDKPWHHLRCAIESQLDETSARKYLRLQNKVADEFVEYLISQKPSPEGTADQFVRYATESIGILCFNTRLGFINPSSISLKDAHLLDASRKICQAVNEVATGESIIHSYYRNSTYEDYESARNAIRDIVVRRMERAKGRMETKQKQGTTNPEEPTLLHSLITNKSLNEGDVSIVLQSLFINAVDPTAKALEVFLYNLATNQEKQDKLRSEVLEVIGPDSPVTAEALKKMPYMKACLKESLRLISPTLSGNVRVLTKDVVLSGYRVPADTLVASYMPKMSHDYFQDADNFVPERWIPGTSLKENAPRTASIPFGIGPRCCAGQSFAEQEIYVAAAKLLKNVKIEVECVSKNTNFIYLPFASPEKPIRFTLTKI